MNKLYKGLAVLGVAILLAPAARAADDVPNFNKRGDNEKQFVERVAQKILQTARATVKEKNIEVKKHKFNEVKTGRTNLEMEVGYKGSILGTKYTANVTVALDTTDKDKWEVLSINFEDNNKAPFNKSGVADLVKTFNK